MTDERSMDLLAVWRGQPAEPSRFTPHELKVKATAFQKKIARRNAREYVGAAIAAASFGAMAWRADTAAAKAGPLMVVAGALFLAWKLHARGASRVTPDDAVGESCVAFHRGELGRQRDLLRDVWRWYLGPLVPGLAVMCAHRIAVAASRGGVVLAAEVIAALIVAVVFLVVWRVNEASARALDREIEQLAE